jgi:hypothetical protein
MAGFYQIGLDLLTTFGFDCVVNKYTTSAFNVNEGEYTHTLSEAINGKAVLVQLDTGTLKQSGYLNIEGDKSILLSIPTNKYLEINSEIVFNSQTYKIAFISQVKDVLETALYKVVIREK